MTCDSKFETKSSRVFVGIDARGHEMLIKSTIFLDFSFCADATDVDEIAKIKTIQTSKRPLEIDNLENMFSTLST